MANAPAPPGFWADPRIWWPRSATRERSSHGLTRGLRPERGRSAVIGPPRGQRRGRWRLDIGRLLGDVPRADTIMAEQVLEGLAGMFGLGPRAGRARRPGQHAAGRYAAWQAAERSGGGGHAIRAGAGRHATPAEQVLEANRVVAPHRAPVSGPGLHTGPVDAEADLPSHLAGLH